MPFFVVFLQIVFIGFAEVLAIWIQVPWAALIGIAVCGLAAILGGGADAMGREAPGKCAKVVVAASAILIPGSLVVPRIQINTLDNYYAIIAWLLAATVLAPSFCRLAKGTFHEAKGGGSDGPVCEQSVGGRFLPPHPSPLPRGEGARRPQSPSHGWRKFALVWGFIGSLTWLAASYDQNQSLAFHIGLAISVALLVLARIWMRLNVVGIQIVHTLILFLIGLPLIDLFVRPSNRLDTRPETRKHYYSYNAAKKNPVAFADWWDYYNRQWEQLTKSIAIPDPSGKFPWRLRPGSSGEFFQSHVVINSKGFRGKEFSPDKGRAFRVVAVGESTTFGVTMNADDKPWPELLEEMIRVRLHPERPVEVINAGIPVQSLKHTLLRLETEILPLKPDMILCYHGFNGFYMLLDSLPRVEGPRPPKYEARPLKLLADAEYGLKIRDYKKGMIASVRKNPPHAIDPMNSAYARAYRVLIQAARTNHIRLAIANFSMAANSNSDNDVVEFYRAGFPAVHWQIQVNAVHAMMVRQLAQENPDICFVDTHPRLDGFHEKFIDLMHLTQEGRQEVAEAFYAGIEKTLRDCLGKSAKNSTANN